MTHLSLKDQKRFTSLDNRRTKLFKSHFAVVKQQKELISDAIYGIFITLSLRYCV